MKRDGFLPLYEQVRRELLSKIEAGHFPAGSFLPPEADLCVAFGVSRITLRRAVSELCTKGLLIRQQGRGTLVAATKMRHVISLSGFSDVVEGQGHKPGYRVLERNDQASEPSAAHRIATSKLVRFVRVLEVDNYPMTLEALFVDGERFAEVLNSVENGKSFFISLRKSYSIEPGRADRLIDVGFATAAEAEILGITTTEPVYRIEKLVFDRAGVPIAISQTVTPCSRVTLMVKELSATSETGNGIR